MLNKTFLRKSVCSVAIVSCSFVFSSFSYAGMYIVNNSGSLPVKVITDNMPNGKHSEILKGNNLKLIPKINRINRVRNVTPYKIISNNDSRYVSAKPVIVGPVGYAKDIPLEIFLQQISPEPEKWKLNCSSVICNGKVVSWSSNGSVRWMDLFYNVISPHKDFDVSFNNDTNVVSISYIKGYVMNWSVNGSKTLKENMSEWSLAAGYVLKWNTIGMSDWEIGNSFTLRGSYDDVILSLIKSYREQGVILTAVKFKNNVIEIKQHYSEYGL